MLVYPVPALVIVILETISVERAAVAVAVVYPLPSAGGVKNTDGVPVYPAPALVISIEEIVP